MPWASRETRAVRANPRMRPKRPASQDASANPSQPTATSGPSQTPARASLPRKSARRRGMRFSWANIATTQSVSATSKPRSTPLDRRRRSPLAITPGVARTDARTCARRSSVDAPDRPEVVRGSDMRPMIIARSTAWPMTSSTTGRSSADASRKGCQAMSPPLSNEPEAMPIPSSACERASAVPTGRPGSIARTASTNHASSGPESSARKTPMSAEASTNAAKSCASR